MAKRKRLSDASPVKQTPPKGKAQTPNTRTPTQNRPVLNGKGTPQNHKVTIQSPKTTPKGNQSTPKRQKVTPHPKKEILRSSEEEDEEKGDEIVLNFNKHGSPKVEEGFLTYNDEDEEPANKKLKKSFPLVEEKSDEQDARSLFVKCLPSNLTKAQIKAWSKDIIDVRLRVFKRLGKNSGNPQIRCAFLDFESEAKADLNYKKFKVKKVDSKELNVDYVGVKSIHKPVKKSQSIVQYDQKKLFVAGLSQEVTKADLEELFPKSKDIVIPKTKKNQQLLGYGFITFVNESDCKYAHDETQNKTLKGSTLVVQYSTSRKGESGTEKKSQIQEASSSDDDDEEEDDDDEVEEDDDDNDDGSNESDDDSDEDEEDMDMGDGVNSDDDDSDGGDDDDDDDDNDNNVGEDDEESE